MRIATGRISTMRFAIPFLVGTLCVLPARGATAQGVAPVGNGPAPVKSPGLPPDSMKPKPVKVLPSEPPADAVALCGDGSWVIAPSDPSACASRGNAKILFTPTTRQVAPLAAARSTVAQQTPSANVRPDGTTMQCMDGTYLFGAPSDERCRQNGGVGVTFPPSGPPRRP